LSVRLAAVGKNSNHEFVALKMSSFKLVFLWGGLKVRNLRLSLNKGIPVPVEDAFFFSSPVPHCFDYCSFVVLSGRVMPPALIFIFRIALAILGLFSSI